MLVDWKKNYRTRVNDPGNQSIVIDFRDRMHLFVLFILVFISQPSFSQNCNQDIVFKTDFQQSSNPSNGNRGPYPGAFNRTIVYNGIIYTYYVAIPSTYHPRVAIPLVISLHGAAGTGTSSINAKATRDFWQEAANVNGFIIVAQTSTGQTGGGWVPEVDIPILFEIMKDMDRYYNIEKNRIYGHGFSAGGHLMHGIMLAYSEIFAAYAISAGVLEAFAGTDAPSNATRKIPLFVSIGLQDTTGPNLLSLSRQNHTVFNNAGWVDGVNYWIDEFNGGHQLDNNLPQKAWNKLCNHSIN
jgi:predicted peptidase